MHTTAPKKRAVFPILIFSGILCLCFVIFALTSGPLHAAEGQLGTIAFAKSKLSTQEIDFLKKFMVIITGNFSDAATTDKLKAMNAKLIYYDWLPALYYCDNNESWAEDVYAHRFTWTLDPDEGDPNPMGSRWGCKDFFYDMGNDDLINARVQHLSSLIKEHKYDGVFFDWGSGWNALIENNYTFLTDEFLQRHPGASYDARANEFIRKLKDKGLLVVMNRGYRSANSLLDTYADIDIVESMFTTDECDGNAYEIYMKGEGLRTLCDTWFNRVSRARDLSVKLPSDARSVNPGIKFLFYNYAFPFYRTTGENATVGDAQYTVYERATDRQAIHFGLAAALLGDGSAFAFGSDDSMDYIMDDVYFHYLGTPVAAHQALGSEGYLRFYSKGFVIVSKDERTVQTTLPQGVTAVVDLYTKQTIQAVNGKVTVSLISQVYPSGARYPIGRLFLYGGGTAQNILSVTKSGAGAGNVADDKGRLTCNGTTCTGTYDANTLVTLTAAPSAGSILSGWTGCDSVSVSQCRIALAGDKSVTAAFALSAGITVTSPNGGEVWVPGTTRTITWDYAGSVGTYVKIELFKGGVVSRTLTSRALTSTKSFSWAIPSSQTTGSDYRIKVTSITNASCADMSDGDFTIGTAPVTPTITVISPNGGESWKVDTQQTIRWTYTGDPGTTVKIELLKGGVVYRTLTTSASIGSGGTGTYSWPISLRQPTGSDYRIRITSTADATKTDTSDNNFSITR